MKKMLFLLLLVPVLLMGAGEYNRYDETYFVKGIIDTVSGDSTLANFDVTKVLIPLRGFDTYYGQVIVSGPYAADSTSFRATDTILGAPDSVVVRLFSASDWDSVWVDSLIGTSLPCTLTTTVPSASGDTLLLDYLKIQVFSRDSSTATADSIFNYKYKINLKGTLK